MCTSSGLWRAPLSLSLSLPGLLKVTGERAARLLLIIQHLHTEQETDEPDADLLRTPL